MCEVQIVLMMINVRHSTSNGDSMCMREVNSMICVVLITMVHGPVR